jgi:XTP/dITP diphosphohydrolase
MDLIFATNNAHKLKEIREITGQSLHIIGLKELGFNVEVPETGSTLEENARQKAWFVFKMTGKNCFADDTGLEVEALDGRPGVYSSRYAGEACSFDDNIKKLISELNGIGNRKARFSCVICLIRDGKEHLFEGRVNGIILQEKRGSDGFGYDPVFQPSGHRQTFAEMPPYLKNGISHRGRAVSKMIRFLRSG